jgi:hypothetical protein
LARRARSAEKAAGGDPCAIAKRPQLGPNDFIRDRREPARGLEAAIGASENPVWIADRPRGPLKAVSHDFRTFNGTEAY